MGISYTRDVLRDVLTAQIPLILRCEIYATAAIVGITVYLLLQAWGMPRSWAFGVGMVVALRVLAILWDWHLPIFCPPFGSLSVGFSTPSPPAPQPHGCLQMYCYSFLSLKVLCTLYYYTLCCFITLWMSQIFLDRL